MAARQDQTLQIALIGTIFLFIVFFVLWYMNYRWYTEATQRTAELTTQLSGEQERSRNLQVENEDMREMMGFGRNDNFPDVQRAYEEDMKRYGAAYADETRRFYRDILDAVYQDSQKTAAREAAAKEQISDISARLMAVEAEKERQVAQFDAARQKAEEDAAAQRRSFAQDRAELEKTKADLLANLEKQRATYETQISERDTRFAELEDKATKLDRALQNLISQQPDFNESFEVADGRISWVNQNGTVWINLGAADSLRRQVTFSVYDGDRHDAGNVAAKGSIEVTRLLGDHMAEARVTSDDPTNPILTGDWVYSQVWNRGKKLRFGFAGIIDIDGDGASDLQLARELVELNGGAVDALVNERGEVEGEMTVNTRYLVLGSFPEEAIHAQLQDGWNALNEQASTLGVKTITLDEFLNQMGYAPQDRMVRLGSGAAAGDFPAQPIDRDAAIGTGNARPFRERTPYRPPAPTPY